jgi:tripartite-type tricarboxylate transporter receptor subunit TctC
MRKLKIAFISSIIMSNMILPVHAEKTTIYVSQPPGGISDIIFRHVAKYKGDTMVVNMPGVLNQQAPRAAFTNKQPLGVATSTIFVDRLLHESENTYDIRGNFNEIFIIGNSPTVLVVNANIGVSSFDDFRKFIKNSEPPLYAVSSSMTQFAALDLLDRERMTGLAVPYKGGSNAVKSILSNETHFHMGNLTGVKGLVEAGKLKIITYEYPSSIILNLGIAFPRGMNTQYWRKFMITLCANPHFISDLERFGFQVKPIHGRDFEKWYQKELQLYIKLLSKHNDTISR